MPKSKFYAVKIGRGGPQIVNSWDECRERVDRWPGAVHKSFPSRTQAERWLAEPISRPVIVIDDDSVFPGSSSSSTKATDKRILPEALTRPRPPVINQGDDQPKRAYMSNTWRDGKKPSRANATEGSTLSHEQSAVLDMVKEGHNVFFTGSAGTGKSVLLREIVKSLKESSSVIGITASTGIASVNIGGTTVHSWAGIGLGVEPAKKLAGMVMGQPKLRKVFDRWRETDALIIDEVSMIDGVLFDKLEYMGRILRNSEEPFGGIQLILSGDFCQLPPVPGRQDGVQIASTFAFEAESWSRCIGTQGMVTLTKVFRQKDESFVKMLNAMRFGLVDSSTVNEFKKLTRAVEYTDGIGPTQLYPTRKEVDTANETQLRQITSDPHMYSSLDLPGVDSKGQSVSPQAVERLLERMIAAKSLTLKVGAQVMLIKNLVQGELVNGSVGQVIGFSTSQDALTNHTEIAEVAENKTTVHGNLTAQNPAIKNDRVWPVVRFTNGKTVLIVPNKFTVNNADGHMEASREQVPLILAWALSIHKSQGQTLERVKVDLGRIFEKGQAYVALSRATSLDTLQVLKFEPAKVKVHPRVLEWHEDCERSNHNFGGTSTSSGDIDDEMDNFEAMDNYFTN